MAVDDRFSARLAEIARLLGCPVESFFGRDEDVFDVGATYELLSLWCTIRQPLVRQRILETIRRELGRDGAAPEAAE
ncbi:MULTISPECIES: hypothetical protein [unclassified Methylobacterium]|jgi:hypothetical protein|uniref:hypothetical protein n=1 Tax=unclassified Methylobacterium TaxID=2615210 RepID=UPI001353A793|nr:hypothetical protein [Methylobacterium sp. 2A]MWV22961.1 hypothetical protein [Methylobacterium sp. 2A]